MRRSVLRTGLVAMASALSTLVAMSGCEGGGSAPSVSSSTTEATVHGTVKYKGSPVTEGDITFDPANIQRKSAQLATVPIGKDGTYTIKTLVGGNAINFKLPALMKKDPSLAFATVMYDVPSGDSTKDIDLPLTNP